MTIRDRQGAELTVPQDCDRDYLRLLVAQVIDRSGMQKQEVAAAIGVAPSRIGPVMKSDLAKWDNTRVRLIEWGFRVRVETVTSTHEWSDGRTERSKKFRLHPTE